MTSKGTLTTLLTIFLLCTLTFLTNAATLHVGSGQTHPTIQAAVDASSPGDSIVIHDGTYVENVTVGHRLAIVSQDFLVNGEYDSAILDAGSNYMTGLSITLADGTTVEGLSFINAFIPGHALYVGTSNECRIANNRFGWDDDHANGSSLYLYNSNGCIVEYNLIGRAWSGGIMIDQCIGTEVGFNTIQNVSGTGAYGVGFSGMYDGVIDGSNCQSNVIAQNEITTSWVGVYASGYVTDNDILDNDFIGNVRGVFLGPGGLRYNLVVQNNFSMNGINIVLDGASNNTIVDNVLDGEGTGIWIGYQSPYDGDNNVIGWNIIQNHVTGLWIGNATEGNFIFGNHFAGNTTNVDDHHVAAGQYVAAPPSAQLNEVNWGSPTTVSYFYGSNHRNTLGNYYSSYTGTDTDGDGVGDTGLPFDDGDPSSGPSESYPLIAPPDQYNVEAWYLDADSPRTMYHRDMARPVRQVEIGPSEQLVWVSDQTANENIDYPNGTWTGCLSFDVYVFPSPGDLTLEIGSSSNGIDFTASGAEASIGGSSTILFETTSAAVSVPEDHYLAVRLTNNVEFSHKLLVGGLMSYVSSTGNGDPEWPGTPSGIGTTPRPEFALRQNYPNPFNPSTTISFVLPRRVQARLSIYNIEGKLVTTLVDETLDAGFKEVTWDGKDARGDQASTGVYFYRLTAGNGTLTKKMVLLK